jgi:hypothetical protein
MDGIHNTPILPKWPWMEFIIQYTTHNDKMAMDGIHNTPPIMPKWHWMEFII